MSRQNLAKIDYEQAKKDHKYLWNTYGPAFDLTGGYEDCYDLQKLLENPTKATAAKCFRDQIVYWFQVGPQVNGVSGDIKGGKIEWIDSRVLDIAIRYKLVDEEDAMNAEFLEKLYNNELNVVLNRKG